MTEPVIRAQNLSKTVRSGDTPLTILDGVSFEVGAGATVAIVGASGSGKTTLLGLLAGLDRPTSGEVWLGDTALNGLSEDARAALRRRWLGFVFQSFQLLPALTALDHCAFAPANRILETLLPALLACAAYLPPPPPGSATNTDCSGP